MASTKANKISKLLTAAGNAYHTYEQTVLKGVYDQDWASWYAEYVVQNGLGELFEQLVSIEQTSQFFQ